MKISLQSFVAGAAVALGLAVVGCAAAPPPEPVVPEEAVAPEPSIRELLCKITRRQGRKDSGQLSGRRYTLEERAAARGQLVDQLRRLELENHEQNYELTGDQILLTGTMSGGTYEDRIGANLIATLPPNAGPQGGTEEWVVVGAHYDTVQISPGADDNGSGMVAVLKIASALMNEPVRKRGVFFVFFDQEEVGCIGSQQFVASLKSTGVKVVGAHVIDMVGWDGDHDRSLMVARGGRWLESRADKLRDLYDAARKAANREAPKWEPVVGALRHERFGRSDHESFLDSGIPAALITEEYLHGDSSPHYHFAEDTCETVSEAAVQAAITLVTEAVRLQLAGQ